MEVTTKTKAIILKREPYNENDSRVFVYTRDFGKLQLIARGTQKLSSKLAGHIEPLNFCDMMIIKGKQYDYAGSVIAENVFARIKNDYAKSIIAGEVVRIVDELVKGEEKDEQIFLMLKKFLAVLNNAEIHKSLSLQILKNALTIKLISILGYRPNLAELKLRKGIVNALKILLESKFEEIIKLDISEAVVKEVEDFINKYKVYLFD